MEYGMKIAFDASGLIQEQKTGIPFYATRIIQTMQKNDNTIFYIFNAFSFRNTKDKIKRLNNLIDKSISRINIRKLVPYSVYQLFFNSIPYHFFFPDQADITHFYNNMIPCGVNGKKVVTIHDLTHKAYPETMDPALKTFMDRNFKISLDRADKIATVSEFSKGEIINYFAVDPSKIVVIPSAVNTNSYFPIKDTEILAQYKKKYAIVGEYFLYLGTLEPRKNIGALIDAYHLLKQKIPDAPRLLLGGKKGWLYESIFKKVEELGLGKDVLFLGYVPDEDVAPLMCGAVAFVFPSLYEGFGTPPLEAMACGVPVLTSNCSSLPEVTGDAALLVDPLRVESIAVGLERLVADKNLREELSRKGLERAKAFTWERAASLTLEMYKSVCQQ
jgi:glycosyltransferase involved in cell wall biosynthesis